MFFLVSALRFIRTRLQKAAGAMSTRRHSLEEIAAKLQQAEMMAKQGELQSSIARTLGISVMTYHRWRKAHPGAPDEPQPKASDATAVAVTGTRSTTDRLAELQLENSRLRRLVTDLLLEKVKLEESLEQPNSRIKYARLVDG
jgi:putative transposase